MSEIADIAIFWGPGLVAAVLTAVIAKKISNGEILSATAAAIGAAFIALYLSFFLTFTIVWTSDAPLLLIAAAVAASVLPSLMIFVPVTLIRRRYHG